ncbi:integrase [Catenulispora sp. GAS73]|uniref:tyrosine-type recombinase/integrase n=1 Tax=Catenulispora sp. GAS73 TaxID=3156269 RepID=UPI0035141057
MPMVDAAGKPVVRRLGVKCPKLCRGAGWNPRHGTWYFQYDHADAAGARVVVSFGSLATRVEAEDQLAAVQRLLGIADELGDDPRAVAELRVQIAARVRADHKAGLGLPEFEAMRRAVLTGAPVTEHLTVGQWLTERLAGKTALSVSTRRMYASQVRTYLIPHLGRIPLDRLRVAHVTAMFDAIAQEAAAAEANNVARREADAARKAAWASGDRAAWRQAKDRLAALPAFRLPCHAATRFRLRSALRSALSAACAQQLVTINVAALAEIGSGRSPKGLVWTPERVAYWQATGNKPSPVMVWTAEQTCQFLDRAARHEWYALYLLVACTGLRRGEACGLRWIDVDLDARMISPTKQRVQNGWEVLETDLKSDASERDVGLADQVAEALRAQRDWQQDARERARSAWVETGLVFTTADGEGLHPAKVTAQFKQLAREAGLPPVRLHDLRHGAASLALAAGVDLKVVSDMLGHSGTAITRDIYTSVYDELKHAAAAAIAAAINGARATAAPPKPSRRTATTLDTAG